MFLERGIGTAIGPLFGAGMVLVTAASTPVQPPGWLNVQDFGATGSLFETTAATVAGSKEIRVADPGDFKPGQQVMITRAFARIDKARLWGPNVARSNPLTDEVMEVRGYDGSAGSWLVFLLEVDPGPPTQFRWTDDIGRTWHEGVPITYDWQPLSQGIEVRFHRREWDGAYAISFSARDLLVTTIERIEGNVFILKDAPNRTTQDAVVRHCDDAAIQAAIDQALKEQRNVFFPPGTYRLSQGVTVGNAQAITLEGSSEHTVLDISEGEGACITLQGGTEVTLRNFRMVGHTGFANADQCGNLGLKKVAAMWGMYLKGCNAVTIRGTERVLVENCHATRMASECFYAQSPSRQGRQEPKAYTKSITYLRCSAIDCGRNGFNNNDLAENTRLLYCRIVDVGGCSWEGASRFVHLVGNYVRNAGPFAMGNIGTRAEHLEELGSGQHFVVDNVFEGCRSYGGRIGGPIIAAAAGATQIVIANNLFINFNSSGIALLNTTSTRTLPPETITIRGNILDLTCVEGEPVARTGISVAASNVIVSDNQVYVRGASDSTVTGISLAEPAINVNLHDNLIRHCGVGLATSRAQSTVTEVIDPLTFLATGRGVPLERRQSHRYRGWNLAWLSGSQPNTLSVIESFDPETLRFTLRAPHEMKVGDRFEVFPPSANWQIHHNQILDCLQPMVLDSYGSATSVVADNQIARTQATGVKEAVAIHGTFQFLRNHIYGFDEPECVALRLYPDAISRPCRSTYEGNLIEQCAVGVDESVKGLWKSARRASNRFVECGRAPKE